jgi:hypothetical protein
MRPQAICPGVVAAGASPRQPDGTLRTLLTDDIVTIQEDASDGV